MDFLNSIRRFFEENPRMWIIVAFGVLATGIVVWGIYGGFGVQIGRFFAFEEPANPETPTPEATQTPQGCDIPQAQWHCETGDCDGDGYPNPAGPTRSSIEGCNDPNDGNICVTGSVPLSQCQQASTPPPATPEPQAPGPGPGNATPTPAPAPSAGASPGEGVCPGVSSGSRLSPATMGGDCGATQNVVTWQNPTTPTQTRNNLFRNAYDASGNVLSSIVVFSEVGCWNGSGTGRFVDTNIPALPAGSMYWYVMKTSGSPNAWSQNALKCVPPGSGPTPMSSASTSPAPTSAFVPSSTPTPTPVSAVTCRPETQATTPDQTVILQAIGGNGTYQWNVSGGGIVQSGGDEIISISYHVPGLKYVRVTSAGATATCTVNVASPVATPTPSGGSLIVQKLGRNMATGDVTPMETLSVVPNAVIQFVINVKSNSSQPLGNLVVRDTLPPGMSYQPGSTYVQGQNIVVDTITTSGLPLGTLQAGDGFTVRWSAVADHTEQLGSGIQEVQPLAIVTASGIQSVADGVTLQIQGTATGSSGSGGVGTVPTGPGDVLLLALMAAAGLTLVYTGYTRSGIFHRREAEKISRQQEPMDFRS